MYLIDDLYDKKKISKSEKDKKIAELEQMLDQEAQNTGDNYFNFVQEMKALRVSIASKEAQI
jgi:hypothetical protein